MRVPPLLIHSILAGFFLVQALGQTADVWDSPPSNRQHSPAEAGSIRDRSERRNAPLSTRPMPNRAEEALSCLLPPLTSVRNSTIAAGDLSIPTHAKKEYAAACAALKDKKTEMAEKHLRKALQQYPKYSAALVTLGQVLATRRQTREAHNFCSQASDADVNYVPAYLCLADLAAREEAWDEVLKLSNRALEIDPATDAVAYEYNAAANLMSNNLAAAEKSALRALEIDKNNTEPRVHFVLAQIYDAKGDLANETAQLREYLKFAANPDDAAIVKQYLSELEEQTAK
jgi:tetratricopeptide (TPR) repeat protein